ncbi:MAG: hypothetical protein ACU0CA_04555 [Paracoccaceae bacterium]
MRHDQTRSISCLDQTRSISRAETSNKQYSAFEVIDRQFDCINQEQERAP